MVLRLRVAIDTWSHYCNHEEVLTFTITVIRMHREVLLLVALTALPVGSLAFIAGTVDATPRAWSSSFVSVRPQHASPLSSVSSSSSSQETGVLIADLVKQIDLYLLDNNKNKKVDPPDELFQRMEALNQINEPNRSAGFLGEWHVWYTDCPPPSNGQLGPFQGTAGQVILQDESSTTTRSTYQNQLKVPPNDWLTATLDGVWEEWDGQILPVLTSSSSSSKEARRNESVGQGRVENDWGANHWKVTFLNLKIALFGITVFHKDFPPDTSRVWRTTYLDDDIRIVRASKTGKVEDEVIFYTKRTPLPSL